MCIRVKIVSALMVLILFSPMYIIDEKNKDLFNDQQLVVDKDDHDHDVFENAEQLLCNAPRAFTANHGQLENDDVLFYDQGGAVWFTDDGVWFELREYAESRGQGSGYRGRGGVRVTPQTHTQKYQRVILKQEFVGANYVRPLGRERLSWNNNFFYGNDSSKWLTNVPNYGEIWYENIYDGIDLRYYSNANGLKYDFIVHPYADPEQIRIRYNGAVGLEINHQGNMVIKTKFDDLVDGGLIIYQIDNGKHNYIKSKFKVFNEFEYGFQFLDEYDPNERLIIDPIVKLNFSTFLGGNFQDWAFGDISIDSDNNIYLSGIASSPDFPITPGAYHHAWNNTTGEDLFVSKLNHNATKLLYSAIIGGNNHELRSDLILDKQNNTYLVGYTSSENFPTTPGAFDRIINNVNYTGGTDIFICKLNWNGSTLLYSTFLGGGDDDLNPHVALDSKGNAIVTGSTMSSDFPTTQGAYKNSYSGGSHDIFISKLNSNGSKLIFSTFIGGDDMDLVEDIEIDQMGNIYIIGTTWSKNYPVSSVAWDNILDGIYSVIISKFDSNGTTLLYSTFIGGSSAEYGYDLELDKDGNMYALGSTYSTDFPTTSGAYDTTFNGSSDAFILRLNSNGTWLDFATLLGGYHYEYPRNIVVDLAGNIYAAGETASPDFPLTSNAIKKSINNIDIFISEFNSNCSELLYSTYFGGTSSELQTGGMELDSFNNVVITGHTASPDFPITDNVIDTSYHGYMDVFISKFSFLNEINISLVTLLLNTTPADTIYSKYNSYTFRVNITETKSNFNLGSVRLNLDPSGTNIQIIWDRVDGTFTELYDPYDYVVLENTSRGFFIDGLLTVDFNITFNWTYPHEGPNNVLVFAKSLILKNAWYNVSNMFNVENDLIFSGKLNVFGSDGRAIFKNGLVRGGEHLIWTGLTPVYENTTDVYPPADEFDVIIWDEDGNYWSDSPELGQPMNITMITPKKTTGSYNYTINLTGIPTECDKTNYKFTIRIDSDNVTFSNEWPGKNVWQKSSEVYTGVTITDHGGGIVDNKSIMHSISEDNGTTWSDWNPTEFVGEDESITVHDFVTIVDGDDNLIKWQAKDSVGNGPTESEPYRILVDTQPVYFTNPIPLLTQESSTGEIEVEITIIDNTSGVNASTIKYSISTDAGNDWGSWKTVTSFQNGNNVDVKLNLTFPNGTGNRIRWRALDIAGNGPTYSGEYVINVNIQKPPMIPEIILLTPANNSKITTTSVKLSWEVINNYHPGIVFDIKLDTINPPTKIFKQNLPITALAIDNMENGKTYYWTVIPKLNKINGTCFSGVWLFTIDIPLPKAILKTPENNSIITSTLPTLVWSLEYEGTEPVTYDIYFGINKDPPLEFEKLTTTYYAIDTALQDNINYYWKVVPRVGKYEGFRSEIWSFIVNLKNDEIPKFGIELKLNPNSLEIKPGEVKFVSAIVTNLGEMTDNFTVSIGNINGTDLTAEVYRQDTLEIASGENKEFLIMISVHEGSEPGYGNITVIAKSRLAEDYGLEVQDTQVLTIKILEKNEQKERGQPIDIFYFSILLLIVMLIIIFIIVLILVRKKASKKEINGQDSQEVITEAPVEGTIPPEPEPFVDPLLVVTEQQVETLEE